MLAIIEHLFLGLFLLLSLLIIMDMVDICGVGGDLWWFAAFVCMGKVTSESISFMAL